MFDLILDGSKNPMKQTRACEMKIKQPQNGVKLNPKPTPKSKRNRIREKHKKKKHMQRKNNLDSLKNKASKRVNTFDMPRKAT